MEPVNQHNLSGPNNNKNGSLILVCCSSCTCTSPTIQPQNCTLKLHVHVHYTLNYATQKNIAIWNAGINFSIEKHGNRGLKFPIASTCTNVHTKF